MRRPARARPAPRPPASSCPARRSPQTRKRPAGCGGGPEKPLPWRLGPPAPGDPPPGAVWSPKRGTGRPAPGRGPPRPPVPCWPLPPPLTASLRPRAGPCATQAAPARRLLPGRRCWRGTPGLEPRIPPAVNGALPGGRAPGLAGNGAGARPGRRGGDRSGTSAEAGRLRESRRRERTGEPGKEQAAEPGRLRGQRVPRAEGRLTFRDVAVRSPRRSGNAWTLLSGPYTGT
ncbi:uncharacterized protein [Manis javanica]|uniref:uncharacterized protein isoform X1 n=1 Tax=Manis javanica TaxID=9974 RepID=UPI003C6D92A9